MSARALKTFFLVFVWLFATNHCLAANLTTSRHQSTKSHDCCEHQHKEDKNSKAPSDRHSSCNDDGCCQPVIKSVEDSNNPASVIASQLVPVASFSYEEPKSTPVTEIQWPLALAPPKVKNSLLSSLHSAPNAPPFFS